MKLLLLLILLGCVHAAEHRGVVRFGGLPVPGASVTATRGDTRISTLTDATGAYALPDLADGTWSLEVSMQLFATERREVAIPSAAPLDWALQPLPPEKLAAVATATPADQQTAFRQAAVIPTEKPGPPRVKPAATTDPDPAATAELARQASDGFLINGSVNNGASSPFAQLPAFGNFRRGQRSLYNGNFGLIANSSALDARAFSLTGQETPKPAYNRVQGLFSFGGPMVIPGLIRKNGPLFTVNYQWMRNRIANTQTGLMPTAAERSGDFAEKSRAVLDPQTGQPFPGNRIPQNRISAQATKLLELYPMPNFAQGGRYNYQVPVVNAVHQDDLQTRVNKRVRKNAFAGTFAMQSTRTDNPDIFGFLDTGRVLGWNAGTNWNRSWNARTFQNIGVQYSRMSTRTTPWFSGRRNVSAEAGIGGNNQEPVNWGAPSLQFSNGITSLTSPQASLTRNQTASVSADWFLSRGRHNVTFGATHRRQQFNVLGQQDARGTFAFTGDSAGSDFAGFLLGIPDTSSIAFGNADKYLRASVNEAFLNDDFRVNPSLTINAGIRWEYWTPVTEKYGRLVNLQIEPNFASASPVVARGGNQQVFPQPDRNNFAPRIGFSWRPFAASSTVVRGGYGVYYDTSVYQSIATLMSQQAPLSTSLRIANTPETPVTLASAFRPGIASPTQSTTFGVDPGFRVGYLHSWQLSIQRDLPAALQMMATYSGSKGTRGQQQFLPNTFPDGAFTPLSGYTYLVSNGNSNRHAAQLQLRRRLRSGLTASLQHTWAKSIDNAAPGGRSQGGTLLAQNWLDLSAERAVSNFDQTHVTSANLQYTTGMGLKGGALRTGRLASILRDWTLGTQIDAATGLPQTPLFLRPVRGTGVTGTIRADYTGFPVTDAPPGFFLNPAAFTAPSSGWGNAGRNSLRGPSQFVMNASVGRTLRSNERVSIDVRLDAMNVLNSVNYSRWNTVVGNTQFGLPVGANPMRTVQMTARVRF